MAARLGVRHEARAAAIHDDISEAHLNSFWILDFGLKNPLWVALLFNPKSKIQNPK